MRESCRRLLTLSFCLMLAVAGLHAAQSAAPANDTLTFTNGDSLTGTLERAYANACVFKSGMAGEVTVPWTNIRELRTETAFVVLDTSGTAHTGTLLLSNSMLVVTGANGAPTILAPAQIRMIVDPKTYAAEINAHPAPWQSWRGMVAGGFSQVIATQHSSSYTTQINFQRPVPTLAWLPQQSNTILHFDATYGKLSQTGTPTVVTSIFNGSLEQDQDVSKRLFAFANAELDHNYSQGLQLQQAYGGGVGWKWIDTPGTKLAVKADLHWTRQRFLSPTADSFLASSFSEDLHKTLKHLVWTENLSVTPSYTNGPAYQMSGLSSWALPVYKALSLNFTIQDSYINNPQPGFQRNSLQYSTGLQFTLR